MNRLFVLTLGFIVMLLLACAHKGSVDNAETPPAVSAAHPLSRDEAYQRVLKISANPESQTKPQDKDQEFSINLPVEKPEGDQKGEWHSTYVKVFYTTPKKVGQIGITTITCNAVEDEKNKAQIQARVAKLVRQISEKVLGTSFTLNEDRYFRELGPSWEQNVQVPIADPYPPAKAMRLSRGIYKCDGSGGYGFRYDFFLR